MMITRNIKLPERIPPCIFTDKFMECLPLAKEEEASRTWQGVCDKRAKLRQLKSGGKYEKIENEYANDT